MRKKGILITGAAGEIGDALVKSLAEREAGQIITLDLKPLAAENDGLATHVQGDIMDHALLARLGEVPPGDEFRPVLVEVLRRCFGTDPLVVKRLGKEAPGGPEGPHPEVF